MTLSKAERHDLLVEFDLLRREQMGMAPPAAPFVPLPHQIAPDDDWFFWLMEAGRGAGKTATAAHKVQEHLNGPPCISMTLPHRVALIAPTLGDAIESASETDAALTRIEPGATFTQSAGGSRVRWPNGSQVRLFGTHTKEDVERLRAGGNRCFVWAEELATWRHIDVAWKQMMLGLRLGPKPQIIGTTTPKARPQYVEIRKQADHISHAETNDNPNLNEDQRLRLYELYDGTTLGEQELLGKLIEEAEGAIWTMAIIERERRLDLLDDFYEASDASEDGPLSLDSILSRIVVAVDPPGGATEAGIVIAAILEDCPCGNEAPLPHYAVLEDVSGKLTPEKWGSRSVDAYKRWEADRIVAEINYGGDMVKAIIKTVDQDVPYKDVRATRGKRIRAEPIFALYEQRRVHHIETFSAMESEMVQWIQDESDWSPNRLDALVWSLSELSGRGTWKVG